MEFIKDILKSIQPGDDLETEFRKDELINALELVRLSVFHIRNLHLGLTEPNRI